MSSSQSTPTPLGRLVLIRVCLSIAGTFVAGIHSPAGDAPAQNAVLVPTNGAPAGLPVPFNVYDNTPLGRWWDWFVGLFTQKYHPIPFP